ncbi:2-hydroxyacid dehydrogenase [Sanguibacter sp. HDW7]|uniref:2-hydroxyacid dehydrogenase n=1 Tax=Sanguibacter sp. HDW7 TaxID=2714931 RepID=UPI001408C282|nr:NAD(P)-dependent oxidoreductase [Sanguibacter sp. HDW7]QIK82521.1 glyoxylate reductase [Sanguibacter sp. HDW7]
MAQDYVVGLTSDNADADGRTIFGDVGLERLEAAGLTWRTMPPVDGHEATPAHLDGLDAVLSFGHWGWPRELLAASPRLKHLARFGAGFDGIDPAAVAAEGVVLTTTPGATTKPLAASAMTMLLAVAHNLPQNLFAARGGRWDERGRYIGRGLDGATVGIVGFGRAGQELARLLAPFGARLLVHDVPALADAASVLDAELVELDDLLAEADHLVLLAALTEGSHRMVDASLLARTKPGVTLTNVSRGGLVDHDALRAALATGHVSAAGLDVLDPEPPAADDPLLTMENVLVTPHALFWTRDFVDGVATSAIEAIIDVAHGRRPATTVNPDVYDLAPRQAFGTGR